MLGKVGLVAAGLMCLATFETLREAETAGPATAEVVRIIALEADVPPSVIASVQCARRSSAVYGQIFMCRASIGTGERTVAVTAFDGRWVLAGRLPVTASRTETSPAVP